MDFWASIKFGYVVVFGELLLEKFNFVGVLFVNAHLLDEEVDLLFELLSSLCCFCAGELLVCGGIYEVLSEDSVDIVNFVKDSWSQVFVTV